MMGVDLIPVARREARGRRLRLRAWGFGAGGYVCVAAAGLLALHVASGDAPVLLRHELAAVEGRIAEQTRQITSMKSSLLEAESRLRLLREVGDQPDWGVLLAVLAEAQGEAAALQTLVLEETAPPKERPGGGAGGGSAAEASSSGAGEKLYAIRASGLALTQAEAAAFLLRLERTGLFERVELVGSGRREHEGRELVGFTMQCVLKG